MNNTDKDLKIGYMNYSQILLTFILQSEDYGTTAVNNRYHNKYRTYIPKTFKDLSVRVGLSSRGDTRFAITFIAFTGPDQTVKQGFYPVFLYYRKEHKLILAYGLSISNVPKDNWDFNKLGISVPMSIGDYFGTQSHNSLYDNSYVCKVYDTKELVARFKNNDTSIYSEYNKEAIIGFDFETKFDIDEQLLNIVKQYKDLLGMDNSDDDQLNLPDEIENSSEQIEDVHSQDNIVKFSVPEIINLFEETGLQYSPELIKRFIFALMAKPFVILSGLAGSGKTQLALTFAKAMIKDESQKCVVPVGADWTNREPLLGYANALEKDKYVRPKETGVLDLIIRASKPENADKPFFLILDEMNMSYVERYFSDFLSSMESKEKIMLWGGPTEKDDTPASIQLPKNLFIIGTINVDETTYLFSPKVLDRANVIEFKISQTEMSSYLSSMKQIDTNSIYGEASEMGKDFIEKANESVSFDNKDEICSTLLGFFKELKSVNAEFGYRSANEIFRFITMATQYDDSSDKMSDDQILDAAIVQKLLPKLHGSKKTLPPILASLWNICGTGIKIEEATDVPKDTKFPITADKILRMYKYVIANGFTSFAEA